MEVGNLAKMANLVKVTGTGLRRLTWRTSLLAKEENVPIECSTCCITVLEIARCHVDHLPDVDNVAN